MLAPMRKLVSVGTAVLAGGAAAALAVACGGAGSKGATLTPAGSTQDDGSGILAKASVKFLTSTDEGGFEPQPNDQPITYDYGYSGFTYGGFGNGAGGYGGSPYASYQPSQSYNQANRTPDYAVSYTTDGGSIEGTVTWPKPPKVPSTIAGPSGCDAIDTSLPIGSGGALEGAIVYLEKISSGKATPYSGGYYKPITLGGTMEARGCALTPRAQVFWPVPGTLEVANDESTPRSLYSQRLGEPSTRTDFKLESGGSRTLGISAQGIVMVQDQAGALPPAWIVTADHPYYTLSDAKGHFRLDDVVPGDYTVVAWYPPVVTGVKDGAVQFGDPVVTKTKVTVKKLSSSRADLKL
jgi:hypothetical protein